VHGLHVNTSKKGTYFATLKEEQHEHRYD